MQKSAIAAGIMVVSAIGAFRAFAAEDGFLDRFKGHWTGSGKVQRNADTSPWNVRCDFTGSTSPNRISIQGSCRLAIVFRREIGVELTYDPNSGTYRGIYTGARVGPAQLTGTRNGDAMNFSMTWPRPVNGDTQSNLVISNPGNGTLRIIVADNLSPGGPIQQTSNLVLTQRD